MKHPTSAKYAQPFGSRMHRKLTRWTGTDLGAGAGFWLAVMVIGCVALSCLALGLSRPNHDLNIRKSLHADHPTPKLNNIPTPEPVPAPAPAEREPSAPPPHWDQTDLPVVIDKTPTNESAEPALWQVDRGPSPLPRLEPVMPLVESNNEPVVFLPFHEPPPGESPMIRNWKILAAAALLVGASPSLAPAGDTDKTISQRLEELRKTVDALSKKLEAPPVANNKEVLAEIKKLETSVLEQIDKVKSEQLKQKLELQGLQNMNKKLDSLNTDVEVLAIELNKLRKQIAAAPAAPNSDKAFDELNTRLGNIEKALQALQAGAGRVSLSPPSTSGLGRVLLVNMYSEPILFIVNGRNYRVEPGLTTQLEGVPSGDVTYEVFADRWGWLRPRKTTSLQPNETLTVTAK